MTKKKQIIVKQSEKSMIINDTTYKRKTEKYKKIDGIEHIDYVIYEEVDTSKYNKKLDFIKNKLKSSITKERIIEEILKEMSTKEIDRIHRLLNKGATVKRQDGCLGIKIDGGKRNSAYIELFG